MTDAEDAEEEETAEDRRLRIGTIVELVSLSLVHFFEEEEEEQERVSAELSCFSPLIDGG